MLTYQLQGRTLRLESDGHLEFPCRTTVRAELDPPEPFGAGNRPSRTAVKAHKVTVHWDANTGRCSVLSDPPLEPVEVIVEWPETRFEFHGNELLLEQDCENLDQVYSMIHAIAYVVPALLNLDLVDPPVIRRIWGTMGIIGFRWEMDGFEFGFEITDKELQEKYIANAIERVRLFSGSENRRILAALHYFDRACRLATAGNSPWEFMSEFILNLSKVLEVLFGPERDRIRMGLRKIGYSDREIEGCYIPITILRHQFDVAHCAVSLFEKKRLKRLYVFLGQTETRFRKLLEKIISQLDDGNNQISSEESIFPDSQKESIFSRLINTIVIDKPADDRS